jgi:hypothetical protein
MKKPTKALLFSALVFPGAGHLLLKRYLTATSLAAVSLIALYIIVSLAVEQALTISEKIINDEIDASTINIVELATQSVNGDSVTAEYATFSLIICWVIGIMDTYRLNSINRNISE